MKLKTAKGELTAYALACGYVQSLHIGDASLQLYSEHGTYRVTGYKLAPTRQRLFWHVTENLPEARRLFRNERKRLKAEGRAAVTSEAIKAPE